MYLIIFYSCNYSIQSFVSYNLYDLIHIIVIFFKRSESLFFSPENNTIDSHYEWNFLIALALNLQMVRFDLVFPSLALSLFNLYPIHHIMQCLPLPQITWVFSDAYFKKFLPFTLNEKKRKPTNKIFRF